MLRFLIFHSQTRHELDKEEQDLKDHEVIKLDVVRALVRMDTLVRIRWVFSGSTVALGKLNCSKVTWENCVAVRNL